MVLRRCWTWAGLEGWAELAGRAPNCGCRNPCYRPLYPDAGCGLVGFSGIGLEKDATPPTMLRRPGWKAALVGDDNSTEGVARAASMNWILNRRGMSRTVRVVRQISQIGWNSG